MAWANRLPTTHCRRQNTGVASPTQLQTGNLDMKDYVLKEKPEPASNEMVWAFDLGEGSIGKAVRRGNEFGASLPCRAIAQRRLVIPAEFAEPQREFLEFHRAKVFLKSKRNE